MDQVEDDSSGAGPATAFGEMTSLRLLPEEETPSHRLGCGLTASRFAEHPRGGAARPAQDQYRAKAKGWAGRVGR